jgi:polysaccharide pyruvyl transferase WcaK-like protein
MIYHIYANRSNIGDWLSAKGIQKLLSPQEITECLCDRPFIKETMDVLSKATEKDLIVIGGGGLLMDYFVPFWEAFKPVAERIPFCIWGIGCCDLKNEASLPPQKLIEDIVNKSKLCVVRDNLTRTFLENCEIAAPVQCPSVNVIDPFLEKGKDIVHVANYTTAGADTYEAMRAAAMTFAENRGLVYRETNNRIEKDSEKEMAHVLLRYEKSDMVLSSALHGCIIGAAMGLKVLAVSGDRKIDGFMETVGLQDWVVDISDVSLISDKLQELQSQTNPASMLDNIREKNRDVAYSILQIARNLN